MIKKSDRVNIGLLEKRISVYYGQKTNDGMGGSTITEQLVFTTWGIINPVSADRLMQVDRSVQNTTHEITMRYRPNLQGFETGINNKFRLECEGRKFIINTVINNSFDKYTLTIMATQEDYDTY